MCVCERERERDVNKAIITAAPFGVDFKVGSTIAG